MNFKQFNVTALSRNEMQKTKGGVIGWVLQTIAAAVVVGCCGYSVAKKKSNSDKKNLSDINNAMKGVPGW